MKQRQITVLTDASLITCIVQRGLADGIVKAAQEAGAQGATIHYAQARQVRSSSSTDAPGCAVPYFSRRAAADAIPPFLARSIRHFAPPQ